jgi:multiple sugar transport system permease protein
VLPSLLNSAVIACSVAFLNLLLGSPAAYGLARLRFAASGSLLLIYVLTRMVPLVALMIPLYLVVRSAHLLDTRASLIITHTVLTLPFSVWLLREYFMTVPRDLEDAARVDRCNWLRMMLYVLLPVSTPGLVAAAMFAFMFSWNEFLFALLFTNTLASKTVTVAVAGFISDLSLPRTVVAAAGILALLPPVVGALILQRQITQGLVSGAIKG